MGFLKKFFSFVKLRDEMNIKVIPVGNVFDVNE